MRLKLTMQSSRLLVTGRGRVNSYSSLSVGGDAKVLLETSSWNKRVITQENESAGRAKCEVTLCSPFGCMHSWSHAAAGAQALEPVCPADCAGSNPSSAARSCGPGGKLHGLPASPMKTGLALESRACNRLNRKEWSVSSRGALRASDGYHQH